MTGSIETPLGPLRAVTDGAAVTSLRFVDDAAHARRSVDDDVLARLRDEIGRYFDALARGEPPEPFAVPTRPSGTPFQRRVWDAVARIAPGETRSYGEVARAIGRPGAARAVGRANATNPTLLLVPCHRVVGVDGTPTAYAGGVARKRALLDAETSATRPADRPRRLRP